MFKDIPRLIIPSRSTPEQLLLCEQLGEFLTAAISLTERDSLPLQQQRLLCLHRARFGYQRQAALCRSAISPISRVPNEILQEIFLLCLPLGARFLRSSAPLLLLQICNLWRSIALSTLDLWSNMAFWKPPTSNTDILCYPLRFIDRWISRSQNTTLSLVFERDLTYIHLRIYVDFILLDHYSKCRHLAIHLRNESAPALTHFVNLPPASLSHLKSLVLEGLDEANFSLPGRGPIITVFRASPKLRSVMTNGLEFCFSLEHSGVPEFDLQVLPWAQLTHLVITDFVRVEIFAIVLAECAGVQFLRVSLDLDAGRPFDVDQWRTTQTVVLPNLKELHISALGGSHFPSMLNIFQFPGLEYLYFRRSQDITSRSPSDLFSWEDSDAFTDQLHSLRRLSLVGRVGSTKQVCMLLHKTPNLAQLSLDIWTDFCEVIPVVFPLPDPVDHCTHLLLPFLEDLKLYLGRQDFPFPSCFITSAAEHSFFFRTFSAYCSRAYRSSLEELYRNFSSCQLVTQFVLVGNSTRRFDDDRNLIHHGHPKDAFNMS